MERTSRKRKLFSGVQLRKEKNHSPVQPKKLALFERDLTDRFLINRSFYDVLIKTNEKTDMKMDISVCYGGHVESEEFASPDQIVLEDMVMRLRVLLFFFGSVLVRRL